MYTLQINASAESAWDFVIEKRIEAPETFQAIQTYRAMVTLLTQQRTFVKEMNSGVCPLPPKPCTLWLPPLLCSGIGYGREGMPHVHNASCLYRHPAGLASSYRWHDW